MKGRTPGLYLLFTSGMNGTLLFFLFYFIIDVNKFATSMCHTRVLSVKGVLRIMPIFKAMLTGGKKNFNSLF